MFTEMDTGEQVHVTDIHDRNTKSILKRHGLSDAK